MQGNSGGTNMCSGIENALMMLKNRKEKNPVSCIFVLSDGCDNEEALVIPTAKKLINKYNIKEKYLINTYGYGHAHNPKTMEGLAALKDGNFYYIES